MRPIAFATIRFFNADVMKGLDMLAKQGQWDKCIEMADKQVFYFV